MVNAELLPKRDYLELLKPECMRLKNGRPMALFHSKTTDILKFDIMLPAGSAYQPKPLYTGMARDLFVTASKAMSADKLADYLDRRGIIIDKQHSSTTVRISAYFLKRYSEEFLPKLRQLFLEPAFPEDEYQVLKAKRRMSLMSNERKTNYVARNLFYGGLYGKEHPEGRYAEAGDEENLSLEEVKEYYKSRFKLGGALFVLSGNYDESTLRQIDGLFAQDIKAVYLPQYEFPATVTSGKYEPIHKKMPSSVQTTLRMGRLLPFDWRSQEYARFQVLTTVLGGYLGSRLMSNIREEKGYTYGVYAATQAYNDSIVFYVTTDVGSELVEAATKEIRKEMDRMANELVPQEELDVVCNYMAGDFLRSTDGVFERSERYCQMEENGMDERYTENYLEALKSVKPLDLKDLAQKILNADNLLMVSVGK